jgi:peptide deformylase
MERMDAKEKIRAADLAALQVLAWPDPRLREKCVEIETMDDDLFALVETMAELMFDRRGVGLAAPQVGVPIRLFLASPSFSPDDLHIYINPKILSGEGSQNEEEGCLSFPGIFCKVKRAARIIIEATNLDGERFRETCEGLHAHICQHENDHLDGILLEDRMGSVAKLANRKALRALEEEFAEAT